MPLLEDIQLRLGAQEPWPKDVKLFQPFEMEQILLPDNANCLAVQAFLKMCNLQYEVEPRANAEFMSPSGKVPFIKCGAFVISELEGIVHFVAQRGITLTSHLNEEQKSDLRAYTSLVRNVLENAELYICWCDKETYNEVTKPRYGCVYPWPLNYIQTWSKKRQIINHLKIMKWFEKSLEDVYNEVEKCCEALNIRLQSQGSTYFFGNQPCELDALLYGHTLSILTCPISFIELPTIIKRYPGLIKHCQKIHSHIMGKAIDLIPADYSRKHISMSEGDHNFDEDTATAERTILTDTTAGSEAVDPDLESSLLDEYQII